MVGFEELQRELGEALAANRPGSTTPHVCVLLPSFSVGDSLLSHYADRIPALEHRYLVAMLMLHRIESCEMVFIGSAAPEPEIIDYYCSLLPHGTGDDTCRRLRIVEVPDRSSRSVAAKLIDHQHLLADLRESFAGRPVFIEPWNVTDDEVEVALQLGAPINGTDPRLWNIGFKSAGRKLFAQAGVPAPIGREDVCAIDGLVEAIESIRARQPDVPAVIVKHDNSGAGDGNVVIGIAGLSTDDVRAKIAELEDWYLDDLCLGSVVEERIVGQTFTSPSVQVDIRPDGEIVVLATHEQILDGDGQVYSGCRFPADPRYAAALATHGRAVGDVLAAHGAVGRFALDFAAADDDDGNWRVFALEINLRKGGTTHPYAELRHLVPGRYIEEEGRWACDRDGSERWYWSSDNFIDEAWKGLAPTRVIEAVARAGLGFDHGTGVGVVLHMLSGLAIDGRCGVTAIGRTDEEARTLYDATRAAITSATDG